MASNYTKRLERLQEAYAAQLNRPVASRFLAFDPDYTVADYERLQDEELDRMVAVGEIRPGQRSRVKFIRWLTSEEYAERKQREVDGPVPAPVQPPAPEPDVVGQVVLGEPEPDERSAKFNRLPLEHPDLGIV